MVEKLEEEIEVKADEYALEESTACNYGESSKHVYQGYFYGFKKGAEFGYNKAKEEMQEQGLALQSDMDKTIEQNIQLKKQIEKMKDCSNCKYRYIQDNADLGEGTRTDPCLSCRSHNMWELEND